MPRRLAQLVAVAGLLFTLPVFAAPSPPRRLPALAALLADAERAGAATHEDEAESLAVEGYGEAVVRSFDRSREDGRAAHLTPTGDLLRVVIELERRFSAQCSVEIEYEWEHAGVLDEASVVADSSGRGSAVLSGESSIDKLVLDWRLSPALGLRAGKLLIPLGFENEGHEPPDYLGALRTDVETRVLPTTWGALGAGVFGALPRGFSYRAYLVEGLDAARFSAESGIREGRQNGSQARLTHPAVVARLDWRCPTGLGLGGGLYSGDSWQGPQPATGTLHARLSIGEAHAQLERGRLRARAIYVMGGLLEHEALSRELGVAGTSDALGRRFFGGYFEAGYDVLPGAFPGTAKTLIPFVRWEESDTQDGVGAVGTEDPSRHRSTLTAGFSFQPHADIVIKADRQQRHNETRTETSQWNVALGYRF